MADPSVIAIQNLFYSWLPVQVSEKETVREDISGVRASSSAFCLQPSPGILKIEMPKEKIHFPPFFLGLVPAALLCHLDANKPVQSKLLIDSTLSCPPYCKLSLGDSEWFNQSSWDHLVPIHQYMICILWRQWLTPYTTLWHVLLSSCLHRH